MPADKKIIAVVGATGHQGVGLIRAILNEGDKSEYSIRAITKDVNSEMGQWLKKNNVDVRDVDVNDEAAITKALEGVYGLYAVTFYWQHMNAEEELRQGRNLATAAKKSNVRHVVWSTLEDTRPFLEKTNAPTIADKYKVPPFDVKAEVDRMFEPSNTTFFIPAFFWDNFIDFGMGPKKAQDGSYYLNLPMGKKRLAGIASEDVGRAVLTIFKRPNDYMGKRVGIASEYLTMPEICSKMSKVLNKEIRYQEITFDDYRRLNFPGARELGNMFQYYHDFEEQVLKIRCTQEGRKLNPEMMPFDQWLSKYKGYIPLGA